MKALPVLCLLFAVAACRSSADTLPSWAGVTHITIGETTFFIGSQQVSNNNQNPIFARLDGDDLTYVRTDYETTDDDRLGG